MKTKSSTVLGLMLAAAIAAPAIVVNAQPASDSPPPFKYGLYVHFDISTFAGYQVGGTTNTGHVPPERYAPTSLDVAGWIRTAQQAGMDCAVLTVKHEAGFCMWDAADYDYDVASSPVKTDVLAAFITACKAGGIIPGIHYSIPDAHNEGVVLFKGPVGAEYFEFIRKQTRELHTRYPDIRVHVFDMAYRLSKSQQMELTQMVKELNPSCAVLFDLGKPAASKYASDTVNKNWLWSPDAELASAQKLYEKYSKMRSSGWSFLLNVGPDPSGRIPDSYTAVLMSVKELIGQNPPQ